MVKPKKLDYEINHFYSIRGRTPEVAVGDTNANNEDILRIFSKSLPLGVDMDRIPVLRGINIIPLVCGTVSQMLNASGLWGIEVTCEVWNGSSEARSEDNNFESMDLLGFANFTWNEDDATAEMYAGTICNQFNKNFQGGLLLSNKITVETNVYCSAAVATNVIPENICPFDVFLEVDWFPVSKEEAQQYLNEMLYAEED